MDAVENMIKLIVVVGLDNSLLGECTLMPKGEEYYDISDIRSFYHPECDKVNHWLLPEREQRARTENLINLIPESFEKNKLVCIITQSMIVFYTIRLAVKKGILKPDEVEIRWCADTGDYLFRRAEYQILWIDSNGRVDPWPKEFFGEMDNLLSEL